MAERLCKECEGLVVTVATSAVVDLSDDWDIDLMCVVCGAALSLGGLLEGEAAAAQERLAG